MMMSPSTLDAPPPAAVSHVSAFRLECNSPQTQYCDLFSRLGFSDPADSRVPGLGQAHLASQREGKVFLEPFLALSVQEEDPRRRLFEPPAGSPNRSLVWHPWGCRLEQTDDNLLLRMTAAYADADVVAIQIELANTGATARHLRLQSLSLAAESDADVAAHAVLGGGDSLLAQTSRPSSSMQIRREPSFRILTAFRRLFEAATLPVERGLSFSTPSFVLEPGQTQTFALYASAASFDLPPDERRDPAREAASMALLNTRLNRLSGDVSADIDRAIQRWTRLLDAFPVEEVEPVFRPLLHQAAVILMKNSVRPHPEEGYGGEMGGHLGTFPARSGYEGFWIWDSAIHTWGFRHFHSELARDNIRIMLRHQRDDGGLFMLHPDSKCPSTQPPLFADAAMRIHALERNTHPESSRAFLEEIYPRLRRWNDWWFAACDPDGNGLAAWPDNLSSGWDDSPRWDTDIPAGPRQNHGAAPYEAVDLNSFLVADLRRLADMADVLDRPGDALLLRERADRLARLIVDHLYCPEDNLFYDWNRDTRQWNRIKTPACFMPLWAGVPLDPNLIRDMLNNVLLNEEHFFGPCPFPSVAYSDPRHEADGRTGYWRGPVWLNQAWFMLSTLHQHRNLLDPSALQKMETARQNILQMALDHGIHENYNSQSGSAGAWSREHQSWSAAALIEIAKRQY